MLIFMEIRTRYASICPQCSFPIAKGATVEWERGKPARHVHCPTWDEYCADPTRAPLRPKVPTRATRV